MRGRSRLALALFGCAVALVATRPLDLEGEAPVPKPVAHAWGGPTQQAMAPLVDLPSDRAAAVTERLRPDGAKAQGVAFSDPLCEAGRLVDARDGSALPWAVEVACVGQTKAGERVEEIVQTDERGHFRLRAPLVISRASLRIGSTQDAGVRCDVTFENGQATISAPCDFVGRVRFGGSELELPKQQLTTAKHVGAGRTDWNVLGSVLVMPCAAEPESYWVWIPGRSETGTQDALAEGQLQTQTLLHGGRSSGWIATWELPGFADDVPVRAKRAEAASTRLVIEEGSTGAPAAGATVLVYRMANGARVGLECTTQALKDGRAVVPIPLTGNVRVDVSHPGWELWSLDVVDGHVPDVVSVRLEESRVRNWVEVEVSHLARNEYLEYRVTVTEAGEDVVLGIGMLIGADAGRAHARLGPFAGGNFDVQLDTLSSPHDIVDRATIQLPRAAPLSFSVRNANALVRDTLVVDGKGPLGGGRSELWRTDRDSRFWERVSVTTESPPRFLLDHVLPSAGFVIRTPGKLPMSFNASALERASEGAGAATSWVLPYEVDGGSAWCVRVEDAHGNGQSGVELQAVPAFGLGGPTARTNAEGEALVPLPTGGDCKLLIRGQGGPSANRVAVLRSATRVVVQEQASGFAVVKPRR